MADGPCRRLSACQTFFDLLPEGNDSAVVLRSLSSDDDITRGENDSPFAAAPTTTPLTFGRLRSFIQSDLNLGSFGLGIGDRVCVVIPNGPIAALAFLAFSQFCTFAPLNASLTEAEFDFEFEDLPARAVVIQRGAASAAAISAAKRRNLPLLELVPTNRYDEEQEETGHEAQESKRSQKKKLPPAGLFSLQWMMNPLPPLLPEDERQRSARGDDIALVLHTSGTTNKPKIVPLTHHNIASGALMIASTMRLSPNDVCVNIMPLFHIHGLIVNILASVVAGASAVATPGNLPPKVFLDRLSLSPRPTWYSAVPTMHQLILGFGEAHLKELKVCDGDRSLDHSLHTIRNCSAALLPAVSERLQRLFRGATVLPTYAMTESMPICSHSRPITMQRPAFDPNRPAVVVGANADDDDSGAVEEPESTPPASAESVVKLHSVGRAAGPSVRVLRDPPHDCTDCGVGEEGHVVVKGPCVTPGYEYRPAHMTEDPNERAFTADGWLCTGDKGMFDEDGYLTLSGRFKEIINRGGEKLSPFEIEEAVLRHPGVDDVLAFAMPHSLLGEVVGIAVVVAAAKGHRKDRQMEAREKVESDGRDWWSLDGVPLVTLKQLRAFVQQNGKLRREFLPEVVVYVRSIPKGPTGKPARIGFAERFHLGSIANDASTEGAITSWVADEKNETVAQLLPVSANQETRSALGDMDRITGQRADVEIELMNMVAQVLGEKEEECAAGRLGSDLPRYDTTRPLFELGLDSVLSMKLLDKISCRWAWRKNLSPTLLFDYPTIEKLGSYIVTALKHSEQTRGAADNFDLSRSLVEEGSGSSMEHEGSEVAIVGISCRFPGGIESPSMLWDTVSIGEKKIRHVPISRWDAAAAVNRSRGAVKSQRHRPRGDRDNNDVAESGEAEILDRRRAWGGFIKDLELFDPYFFGISPAEAAAMDPQQRLLLETAYLACLDAGFDKKALRAGDLGCSSQSHLDSGNAVGVFVGISGTPDAAEVSWRRSKSSGRCGGSSSSSSSSSGSSSVYAANATSNATAAGRVSFVFGFEGPCCAYDTACSASLVALHAAVRSLQRGECSAAIVAGVHTMLSSSATLAYASAGMLSPSGACHSFDAAADGYARGEGCGAVVLRRLVDCKSSFGEIEETGNKSSGGIGGKVYAVVRGVAVGQDGTSASLTAPNGKAQERLLRNALRDAKIEAHDVDFLEAHGTGTPLGDPIELNAAATVLGGTGEDRPLFVGSVKANIGHLEPAAGIAGLIHAVLVLQREQAPPNAGLRNLNPKVAKVTAGTRIAFPRDVQPLRGDCFGCSTSTERKDLKQQQQQQQRVLVAGVSSFGYAGTIAHALISQPPLALRRWPEVSGKKASLSDGEEASGETLPAPPPPPPRVIFLFSGQGSQYEGMGQGLYEAEPIFHDAMDRCEAVYRGVTGGESLLELIYPELFSLKQCDGADGGRLQMTQYTQPALFALEWSLAELWCKKFQVVPDCVLGHSIGELVAAVVANRTLCEGNTATLRGSAGNIVTMEEGLRLTIVRARLMQSLPGGVCSGENDAVDDEEEEYEDSDGIGFKGIMMAVQCEAEKARVAIEKLGLRTHVAVACDNGPSSIVLSGAKAAVKEVLHDCLGGRTAGAKRLSVSHAFHSPLMRPIEHQWRIAVREGIKEDYSPPTNGVVPLVSTVTGGVLFEKSEDLSAIDWEEHWVRQVWCPVLFQSAVKEAIELTRRPSSIALSSSWIPPDVIVVEIGPQAVLSRMARRWIEPEKVQHWCTSLEPLSSRQSVEQPSRNNDMLTLSKAMQTIAAAQENYVENTRKTRSEGTRSLLDRIFQRRRVFPWYTTPPHPLLQQSQEYNIWDAEHCGFSHTTRVGTQNHARKDEGRGILGYANRDSSALSLAVEMAVAATIWHCDHQRDTFRQGMPFLEVILDNLSFYATEVQESGTLHCEHRLNTIDDERENQENALEISFRSSVHSLPIRLCSVKQASANETTSDIDFMNLSELQIRSLSSAKQDCTTPVLSSHNVDAWYDALAKRGIAFGEQPILEAHQNKKGDCVLAKVKSTHSREGAEDPWHLPSQVFDAVLQLVNIMNVPQEEGKVCKPIFAKTLRFRKRRSFEGHAKKDLLRTFSHSEGGWMWVVGSLKPSESEIGSLSCDHHILAFDCFEGINPLGAPSMRMKDIFPYSEAPLLFSVHGLKWENVASILPPVGLYGISWQRQKFLADEAGDHKSNNLTIKDAKEKKVVTVYLGDEVNSAISAPVTAVIDGLRSHFSRIVTSSSSTTEPLTAADIVIVPVSRNFDWKCSLPAPPLEASLLLHTLASLPSDALNQKQIVFITGGDWGSCDATRLDDTGFINENHFGLLGLLRTARIEISRARILYIDSDGESISSSRNHDHGSDSASLLLQRLKIVADQIAFELKDSSLPKSTGVARASEVVYRLGKRFTPSLSLKSNLYQIYKADSREQKDPAESPIRLQSFLAPFGSKATVVITGGLGGLGIVTAEMLVDIGVSRIVLVSRSGEVRRDDQGLQQRLDKLRRRRVSLQSLPHEDNESVTLIVEKCDMGVESEVASLLHRVSRSVGPIAIVVHAAGIMERCALSGQDALNENWKKYDSAMRRVWAPKANGAWYLHQHLMSAAHPPLLVFYSSLSALFGNRHESNYSAANQFLDSLARYRLTRHGLPTLSLQWPFIKDVGIVGSKTNLDPQLTIDDRTFKKVLAIALSDAAAFPVTMQNTNDLAVRAVLPRGYIDAVRSLAGLGTLFSGLTSHMYAFQKSLESSGNRRNGLVKLGSSRIEKRNSTIIHGAWTDETIRTTIEHAVLQCISTNGDMDDKLEGNRGVNDSAPLMEIGLDSLAATQLVRQLNSSFDLSLALTVLFDFPSIIELCKYIKDLLVSRALTGNSTFAPKELISLGKNDGNDKSDEDDVSASGSAKCLDNREESPSESELTVSFEGKVKRNSATLATAITNLIMAGVHPKPLDDLIVCVQPGIECREPIVFMYGAMGWKLGSTLVTHFSQSQSIYSLQAPEFTDRNAAFSTLEERATHHYDVLRRAFNSAKCMHLVGYSSGAILGFEVAMRYQNQHRASSSSFSSSVTKCTLTLIDPTPVSFDPTPTGFENPRAVGFRSTSEGLTLLQRARNHDTSLAILAGLAGATPSTDTPVSALSDFVMRGEIRDEWDLDLAVLELCGHHKSATNLLRISADISSSSQKEIKSRLYSLQQRNDNLSDGRKFCDRGKRAVGVKEGENVSEFYCDGKESKLLCDAICFTATLGGLEWFRSKGSFGNEALEDQVYGWSRYFEGQIRKVQFCGGHSDFFSFDENTALLANYLKCLIKKG